MNPQYREYFETAYDIWKAGGTPSFEDLSKSSADDAVELTRFPSFLQSPVREY